MSEGQNPVPAPLLGLDEGGTGDVLRTLSNVALVRAVAVASLALAGSVLGREIGSEWLDPLINVYSLTVVPSLGWYLYRKNK
ncbi:hypothetical protein BST33_00080 [Mycolicibacter minnesotensis]|uniref:Uncharacterized protein n=1 Tax=Mycolicibacter minnesotensis TaxID=1118379 RepID=A0A7I7R8A6_9MYCO|nr:hypothetical protein [Mycolicibacter minnesotensis]ORB04343.1 hypothetical protein BST33_00080 [Mycolicibacter minnesotensis]BBY34913.1 hypothetical protein MMIN_29740 [Mycolicibacter minnesotensis]